MAKHWLQNFVKYLTIRQSTFERLGQSKISDSQCLNVSIPFLQLHELYPLEFFKLKLTLTNEINKTC